MPWATEFLHEIGTVDGVNKNFVLSNAPAFVLAAAFPFALLSRVGSQPNEMEYTLSGAALALGLPPASNTKPWIIYFHD
jgi:hypothetical protein